MKGKEKLRYLHKHFHHHKKVDATKLFKISAEKFSWKNDALDDPTDLCLHGVLKVDFPSISFEQECCVSAAAFSMLKTLTENHKTGTFSQLMPCCGYNYLTDNNNEPYVSGCENGIDYDVKHENENIIITFSNNERYVVPLLWYTHEVVRFAREVESFYNSCTEKDKPADLYENNAYRLFWEKYKEMLDYSIGLYSNELLIVSLHATHKRVDIDMECGEPLDEKQRLRTKYVTCCTQTTLDGYNARNFGNNLTVVFEDKYGDAKEGETEFIADCLSCQYYTSMPFFWHYDNEKNHGKRHIWRADSLDAQRLFKKIILSELGQETKLSCAVYIIENDKEEVFFPYDDRGFAYFTNLYKTD